MSVKTIKCSQMAVGILLLAVFFSACDKKNPDPTPDPPVEKQFMIWASAGIPQTHYFLTTKSLTEGKISPVGNGIDITSQIENPMSLLYKDGYFYSISDNKFTRASISGNKLVAENMVINRNKVMAGRNFAYHFWDGDKLVILESSNLTNTKPIYNIVDTKQLKTIATGVLDIPIYQTDKITAPDGKEVPVMVDLTGAVFREGKIFLMWRYYAEGIPGVRARSGVLDYPAMNNLTGTAASEVYDLFTNINGDNVLTHTDNEGNLYLVRKNSSGDGRYFYVRINKGQTVPDPSYNFYIDESSVMPTSYCSVSDNRQIAGFYNTKDPNWRNWTIDYKLVDIKAGKVIADLNALGLPHDVGRPAQAVIVEDGKAYMAVNGGDLGKFIWEYDLSANKLTRGLEADGGLDAFPFLTRLK